MIFFLLFFLSIPSVEAFSWNIQPQQSSFKAQEEVAFHQGQWQSNSVIIIKDNTILYERYENGFDAEKLHRIWSASKSVSSLLIGKRLQELNLDVTHPIFHQVPELKSLFKKELKVRDLLQMSSGLRWNEYYEGNPFQSDVVPMLYLEKNMGAFTAKKTSRARPGTLFNYSSGETNLLMFWLKRTFETQEEYDNFPKNSLFNPLGIEQFTWEQDPNGTFVGSSYLYLKPRDLARVGRLVLAKGKWGEEQIINPNFLKDSVTNAPATCQTPMSKVMRRATYGYHWWLNQRCPQRSNFFYGVDSDVIMAFGHHGQTMILWPRLNAIAVRLGADKKERFPREEWAQAVQKSLEKFKIPEEVPSE